MSLKSGLLEKHMSAWLVAGGQPTQEHHKPALILLPLQHD
jgi:hypothetical protein